MFKKIVLGSFIGFATLSPAAASQGKCSISILSQKTSGEKLRITFHSKLNSQRECQSLAKMHSPNFTPDTVRWKSVNYEWTGKKNTSAIASSPILRIRKRHVR